MLRAFGGQTNMGLADDLTPFNAIHQAGKHFITNFKWFDLLGIESDSTVLLILYQLGYSQ